jgi:uncharacterized protein YbjQ (UPF0145 family)
MIVSTTSRLEGMPATEYLGIVMGEAIIGANIVKDLLAVVRDVVGGRSGAYEKALREARQEAIREMCERAENQGADAVIGVDIDYEVLGSANGMLMVTAAGTAIRTE